MVAEQPDTAAPCWVSMSIGAILAIRCTELGEHIAHSAIVRTETRQSDPRAGRVEKRHVVNWYDNGDVRILEAVDGA